jgi:uncharacterized protein YecE (DUF72 family)
MIYFGTAGWSYPDWEGIVYPKPRPKGFDPLEYLSGFVDAIEINSSFYAPPPEKNCRSWLSRVADRPDFVFTLKLWRRFTHDREPYTAEQSEPFREAAAILRERGRLGAILAQFPMSFHHTAENRAWLDRLFATFSEFPLVLEVRHGSWNQEEFYGWLLEKGVGFVNLDQPLLGQALRPSARSTSAVGYVRLHGRNYEEWFKEEAGRDERYNYLYSWAELKPWAERIRALAGQCEQVFVVANNHYQGQALLNALQLKELVTGVRPRFPESLLAAFGPDGNLPAA